MCVSAEQLDREVQKLSAPSHQEWQFIVRTRPIPAEAHLHTEKLPFPSRLCIAEGGDLVAALSEAASLVPLCIEASLLRVRFAEQRVPPAVAEGRYQPTTFMLTYKPFPLIDTYVSILRMQAAPLRARDGALWVAECRRARAALRPCAPIEHGNMACQLVCATSPPQVTLYTEAGLLRALFHLALPSGQDHIIYSAVLFAKFFDPRKCIPI